MRAFVDGASRGNPGEAGAGAVLVAEDGRVRCLRRYLGEATNNVAEYQALLLALEEAVRMGARRLEVCSDSQLLVRQMQGRYAVRSPRLKELHRRAREMADRLESFRIRYIPREENALADEMANRAIEEGSKRASRPPAPDGAGGKSALHRAGCWVTPSGGDPRESATETRPPAADALRASVRARVKG